MNAAMIGLKAKAAYKASSPGRGGAVIIMAQSRPVKTNHRNFCTVTTYG
jgi:hypothetical protein